MPDRDGKGRFAAGNKAAVGNSGRPPVFEDYLAVARKTLPPECVAELLQSALDDAKKGNEDARKSLLRLVYGDKDFDRLSAETEDSARKSPTLLQFLRTIHPKYEYGPPLLEIIHALEQVEICIRTRGEEGISRLIVNFPPRSGKTELIAAGLAWMIGLHPDFPWLHACYGDTLAGDTAYAIREIVESESYREWFPRIRLPRGARRRGDWHVEGQDPKSSGILSGGVRSSFIGRGGGGWIDDPHKGAVEVSSESERETVWTWLQGTFRSRLTDPWYPLIISGCRWLPDDLFGRLAVNSEERWRIIKGSALAVEGDPFGRKPDEALIPSRWDTAALKLLRREVGPIWWAGQYQQEPVSLGGRLFDRLKYDLLDEFPARGLPGPFIRALDLAWTEKQWGRKGRDPDWTVGTLGTVTIAEDGLPHMWIRNQAAGQWAWPRAEKSIIQQARDDGKQVEIGIEADAAQSIAVQVLDTKLRAEGFTVRPLLKNGDKLTAASLWHVLQDDDRDGHDKHGRCHLGPGEWRAGFLQQSDEFGPGCVHDDRIDSVSLLAARFLGWGEMGRVQVLSG